MSSLEEVAVIQVRLTDCDSAGGVFVCPGLFDFRIVTCNTRHADAMFVNEFSAGLTLVKKRARRDDRYNKKGDSYAFWALRQLQHHSPGRQNQNCVDQEMSENRSATGNRLRLSIKEFPARQAT